MEGDGGADVSEFLLRIRELGDKRDKEDADRARQLEAEILAGREARRARRDGTYLFLEDSIDIQFTTTDGWLMMYHARRTSSLSFATEGLARWNSD